MTPRRVALVGSALVVALLVVFGAAAWHFRQASEDSHREDLCAQIAGPDGWKYVDGACYDVDPLTGVVSRVDLP